MIVKGQLIETKWHGTNKKHYIELGYVFNKVGEILNVKPEHLPKKSHLMITIECDNCKKNKDKKRRDVNFNGNQFCSNSCAGTFLMTKNNPNPTKDKIKVNCDYCESEFHVFDSVTKKNKWHFCTRECYASYRSENISGESMYNYQELNSSCLICGNHFKTSKWYKENGKDKFCSRECYYAHKNTDEQIEKSRTVTASRIANGLFPKINTSIQIKTKKFTRDLNMDFEEEIQFEYYVVDLFNKEKNLAIEVMGDYWHSNPLKYSNYNELNSMQRKGTTRDKAKNTYLKRHHNVDVLYLWETDINKHPDLCIELIKLFVCENGYLQDYNSFNYHIENQILKINNDIIYPLSANKTK